MHRRIRELTRGTGQSPEVESLGPAKWRVTLANQRVKLTIDYEGHLGKVEQTGSTLAIDGKEVGLARDLAHFTQIFRNPDSYNSRKIPAPAIASIPEEGDISTAPFAIRHMYDTMAAKGLPMLAGYGNGRWVLGIGREGDKAILRIFVRRHKGQWLLERNGGLQLIVNGFDISHEVKGSLSAALAKISTVTALSPPQGHTSPGVRSNAVETRKGSVIRV